MGKQKKQNPGCPCGNSDSYNKCCGWYIDGGESAPSPETLMRSRYCAYTLGRNDYLLNTWHASTRPEMLDLENDKTVWSGLIIISADSVTADESEGVVEFIACYKINGKAGRLREHSRFVKENGCWYYVDGETQDQ